mgnify:CR=1 FL=1
MPEENVKPSLEVIGESGGTSMPTIAGGLSYNPDTINVRTYLEMEDDAQIKAVYTLIKAPLQKVVWSIGCEDQDIARFIRMNLEPLMLSLINNMCNALQFGHQGFEKLWEDKNGRWQYSGFQDLHPDSVRYKKGDRGVFNGIEQYTTKGTVIIPPEKSFVFTNEKRWGNTYGRSKFRAAYMYWFIDKYTYDFENQYFERYANPIIWGQAPSGQSQIGTGATSQQSNITTLFNLLKDAKNAGIIVTASDVDAVTRQKKWIIQFLEAQRRGADYRSRHEYLDLMKARAIFAPELVFSAPYAGSSYALAREHATIFMSAEEAILQEVKNHLEKYIIPQLVTYNFGAKAPKATWDYESIAPETRTLLRDLVMAMVAGDIIRPDPDWISKTIGIKLREEASKTTERQIKQKVQESLLKNLQQQGTEEEKFEPEPGQASTARAQKILEAVQNAKQAAEQQAIEEPAEEIPGLSKSAAAYKRWATTPTPERFRSARSYEKAYSKGLFEDIQNHYIFGTERKLMFDEKTGDVIEIKKSKVRKLRNAMLSLIEKFLPE